MKPLDGLNVIELSTFAAVPAAGRILADWGADVVKIETAVGDEWRNHGKYQGLPCEDDCNPAFSAMNTGKKLVSVNLKTQEGREIMDQLLETADVFLTNIRLGAIKRLGLDYETLHEKYPKLVFFHLSGFGYEGPDKDRPGFDSAAFWSKSGALYEFPEKGSHPMYPPPAFGDSSTANSIVSGICAALFCREKTGEGLNVTTSLYANGIWCNTSRIVSCQERTDGTTAPNWPRSYAEAVSPFSNTYLCKDGKWMLIAVYFSKLKDCLKAFELEEYEKDERFTNEKNCHEHFVELRDLFAEAFLKHTSAEWDSILGEYDLVHQILLSSRDVSKDEQAWINQYLSRIVFPNGSEYVVPNSPVTFGGIEKTMAQHVGGIGSDTEQVLKKLGYSEETIRSLAGKGVISCLQLPE